MRLLWYNKLNDQEAYVAMKKILILLVGLMFVCQLHAGATAIVSKSDDPFEGDYFVFTVNDNPGELKYIEFDKKVYSSSKEYEMKVTMPYPWHIDEDYFIKTIQIKIDDQIYPMNLLKQKTYVYDNTCYIDFRSALPDEAIEALKNANQIMVRVIDSNDKKKIVDFSAKDINNWKDVINTEK
jgi:hypothetical protein